MSVLLSIIVPCYNEENNIPLILEKFKHAINKTNYDIELILIDNNSKDDSAKVLKNLIPKYSFSKTFFQEIPGYGAALKKGLKNAKGEYICWTHADMQTDPSDTIKALELILKQTKPEECYIKGKRKGRGLFDTFFTIGMSCFESMLFFTQLWDINAQPNIFHKSFLKNLKNAPNDFSFDLYAYYNAKKLRYKIIRFKVLFPKRIYGKSSWNTGFSSKWKFIKRTIKFSLELKNN